MHLPRVSIFCRFAVSIFLLGVSNFAPVTAATLRVVTYNIQADTNGFTTAHSGLDTVLEAIGEQSLNGIIRPLDILALQETTSNLETVAPIVMDLNSYYGTGTYAMSSYQGTESGNNPSTGNGPNALIYNARTLQLLASVGVGTPKGSSNGEYRQVVRYEFQPIGGTAANDFYIYVTHMKSSASGTTTAVQTARDQEATIIRHDAATLPASASILYMGDFNLEGSTEPAYQTLAAAGQGKAVDPLNLTEDYTQTWSSSTYKGILTESATAIRYRDDIQFMTQNVYSGSSTSGLHYVPGSYRAFGNNGTTVFAKSVNLSSNTSLNNLIGPITAAQALSALTTASDHLPVVVDYTIAVPEPSVLWLLGMGAIFGVARFFRRRKMADARA